MHYVALNAVVNQLDHRIERVTQPEESDFIQSNIDLAPQVLVVLPAIMGKVGRRQRTRSTWLLSYANLVDTRGGYFYRFML